MCAHTQMTDVRVEVEVVVQEVRRRVEGRVWGQGRGPRTVIERQPNCFMSIDKVNHFPFSHFCLQIIRFVLFTRGFPHESFVLRLFTLVYTYIHKYACVCVCLCTLAVALFNDPKLVPEAQTQNKSKGAGKNSKRIWATIDTCAGRGVGLALACVYVCMDDGRPWRATHMNRSTDWTSGRNQLNNMVDSKRCCCLVIPVLQLRSEWKVCTNFDFSYYNWIGIIERRRITHFISRGTNLIVMRYRNL